LPYQKEELITKITGGMCSICRETPTKIASYDMGGIILIERYCDKCLETTTKKRLKVMIVEDEEDILTLYNDKLSRRGHRL
jgi:hypothetical protein